jgi:hypothetical protein
MNTEQGKLPPCEQITARRRSGSQREMEGKKQVGKKRLDVFLPSRARALFWSVSLPRAFRATAAQRKRETGGQKHGV